MDGDLHTPEGRTVREGNIYGNIEVESLHSHNPKTRYYKYNCNCKNCGHTFIDSSQRIMRYVRENSCPECSKRKKQVERGREAEKHIGEHYGELEIIGYAGLMRASKKQTYSTPYMSCKCHKCGSLTEIPLARLTSGQANECVHCVRKYLDKGREWAKEYAQGGSSILNVIERGINKNNSSGYKGVSWHKESQKWRAYITFQRKQYNLGFYEKLEDAISARRSGEKEIFDNFIEWYKESFPTYWERLYKKKGI